MHVISGRIGNAACAAARVSLGRVQMNEREEEVSPMQALIAFDIADDHRRYRLTRVLLDYGERIQESVFWIDCEDDLVDRIRERVTRVLESV